MKASVLVLFCVLAILALPTRAGSLDETVMCGPPARNAKGEIIRRADVLREFQKRHPCPSTGQQTGACPGWKRDHVKPLACGGCDSVDNLQWLPDPAWKDKTLWERNIYGGHNVSKGCP